MNRRKLIYKIKLVFRKLTAFTISFSFFCQLFLYPQPSYALTGGPSQPEVESFSPIGTSDMVDPFSGDFNYNIPLLQVGDYPLNLIYNSGVTMDQEASWVGLGWNLNPGVTNRVMRGIPDDFDGDIISKEFNQKDNKTFGLTAGAGIQLFGTDTDKIGLGLNYSVGFKFNNYNGVGFEQSISASLSIPGNFGNIGLGLGLTSSSDNGLTVSPSVSLSANIKAGDNRSVNLGLSIGSSFNSRGGLQRLSVSPSVSLNHVTKEKEKDEEGKQKSVSAGLAGLSSSSSYSIGMQTYTPSVGLPMKNRSVDGSATLGGEIWGVHLSATVSGYFAGQKLAVNQISNPAYGYLNLENGQKNAGAILDFNREKDGSFSDNTKILPQTNLTYDIYSVKGQGHSGSYRAKRGDYGYVFDAKSYSNSQSLSVGAEVGLGNAAHGGGDFNVSDVNTYSGKWEADNETEQSFAFKSEKNTQNYEQTYFKEANEKGVNSDQGIIDQLGDNHPMRLDLKKVADFSHKADNKFVLEDGNTEIHKSINKNKRSRREKRNDVVSTLSIDEVQSGLGVSPIEPELYTGSGHHIGQVTSMGDGGKRYVYGIPAFNKKKDEITFASGDRTNGSGGLPSNCQEGTVTYNSGDNSLNNDLGRDNYYNKISTPAYAHSYLLTSVLSTDYIDSDDIHGPSDGDMGSYTRLHYDKINNDYKWRVPFESKTASHSEGFKTDKLDDKASIIYGEKELWYIDSIVTKNYIAIFHKEDRKDGHPVNGVNGGLDASNPMQLLKKISLYSKNEYYANGSNAEPIKEVHFEYDYSLCKGIPNNIESGSSDPEKGGKLTLKKVYFTYGKSNMGRLSPYEFDYSNFNPDYGIKSYDRWGYYKENNGDCAPTSNGLTPAEFPYVEQDQSTADQNAKAWLLENIKLPSGGTITIEYESDDYQFVQNKKAMQMLKVVGADDDNGQPDISSNADPITLSENSNKNPRLYFELRSGFNTSNDIDIYFDGLDYLYFKFLVNFGKTDPDKYDYVPGYAEIDSYGVTDISGTNYGWVQLKPVKFKDSGNEVYSPISRTAIQFGRIYLSNYIWDQLDTQSTSNMSLIAFFDAVVGSSIVGGIINAFKGPNKEIYDKGKGKKFIANKSWIRLHEPSGSKLGGGSRVKKIILSDSWGDITDGQMNMSTYGQEYEYTLKDGTSSGVATYEPQIGGDENPFRKPVFYEQEKVMAPDDRFYQELPYCESMFPSPSVGYSRVTVKNLQRNQVTRHATGKVVHEFFTAKDFPTITRKTSIENIHDRTDPLSLSSIFSVNVRDFVTASQGFVIELNDMHGKEKRNAVFAEGKSAPISEVTYHYKYDQYGKSKRLNNDFKVINNKGVVSDRKLGYEVDVVNDFRENNRYFQSGGMQINVDFFIIPVVVPLPTVVPVVIPQYTNEETQFRSVSTTKIVQRFGTISKVITKDVSSTITQKNLAYDAETGEVLISKTQNEYEDPIFTFKMPAHWYYEGMGLAYKNIGLEEDNVTFNSSGVAYINNAKNKFYPGDEISLSSVGKAWVVDVSQNYITAQLKSGQPVVGSTNIEVIRSGRRNMQTMETQMLTLKDNPLDLIQSNNFNDVLSASSKEYTEDWKSFCDCHNATGGNLFASTNPFVLGKRGVWRPLGSYTHLTDRLQSNNNDNSNIRKDGTFKSFSPFYKFNGSNWKINKQNWTFVDQVSIYSPFGPQLENVDALGRFSSAMFGYNQSLATGVANNSEYAEIGFDGFEDYFISPCADLHFKFDNPQSLDFTTDERHSGTKSIKVSDSNPAILSRVLDECNDIDDCSLDLEIVHNPEYINIIATSDDYPLNWSWNIIYGNPSVDFVSSNEIRIYRGNTWKVEVTVTDNKGCSISQVVEEATGN